MFILKDKKIQFKWINDNNTIKLKSVDNKTEYVSIEINNFDDKILNDIIDLDEIKTNCNNNLTGKECYKIVDAKGLNFGSNMKSIEYGFYGNEECLIKLSDKGNNNYIIDPTFMDVCLVSGLSLLGITSDFTYLPTSCDNIYLLKNGNKPEWVYTKINFLDESEFSINSYILDQEGRILLF